MTEAAKLCINCKFYQAASIDVGSDAGKAAEYSRCLKLVRDTNEGMTRVDGRPLVIAYTFCDLARRTAGDCGPDAKLFEAA